MASGTFYPAVSIDDGWRGSTSGYQKATNGLYIGRWSGGGEDLHSWVRFPNVTIPQRAAITGAFVKFTSYDSQSGVTCNVNCYFNDVDNAVAPVDAAGFDALALTAAIVWNNIGTWTIDVQYDTPSLVSILQNIVDRAGWSSGNALQLIVKNNASSVGAKRQAYSYDAVSGAKKAELHVTWNPPTIIDVDVTSPSIIANGYTGIYASPSISMQQAQGYTGIYSAPSIPIIQPEGFTGITAEPSISMIRSAATLSDNMVHVESSVTIPSMSAKLTQAKQIWGNASIPSMIAEATERETTLANVSIPMMVVELASGIHADLEATAPMATAEGLFSGQAEITIPMMTAELEGKVGRVISSAVKVPMMTVEATGKTEHLANGAVSIPMMRVATKLMTGKIIAGAVEVPMMTAALTSYEDITGDIDVSIPMLVAYGALTPERFEDCVVLRYAEPR